MSSQAPTDPVVVISRTAGSRRQLSAACRRSGVPWLAKPEKATQASGVSSAVRTLWGSYWK